MVCIVKTLHVFWILAPYLIPDLQIFSPIQKVFFLFFFFDGFLCYAETLLFRVVPLVYFGFCFEFVVRFKKLISKTYVKELYIFF